MVQRDQPDSNHVDSAVTELLLSFLEPYLLVLVGWKLILENNVSWNRRIISKYPFLRTNLDCDLRCR